jgi:hypothetical protein
MANKARSTRILKAPYRRVNITIPVRLHARFQAHGSHFNWSAICAEALHRALDGEEKMLVEMEELRRQNERLKEILNEINTLTETEV